MNSTLNERSWQLLKLLIQQYIENGEPVSSKRLAHESSFNLSSATVRNIMMDLEKFGYVTSPHTSAGRIPTERAYRLFVDNLLTSQAFQQQDLEELIRQFNPSENISHLLKDTSEFLSDITHLAGLVTIPKRNKNELKHIEFLPLGEHRVLVILVLNNHEVQNRIIYTQREYSAHELQQATNFINRQYQHKDLMAIRKDLLFSMQQDRDSMDDLMRLSIEMANQAFQPDKQHEEYVVSGQVNLLNMTEMVDIDHLRALFSAFAKKQAILHLLDRCIQTDSLQIFIGKEAGLEVFDNFSIVVAPYEANGEVLGVLGVIGPTRMPYDRVISAVDKTAKLLSDALQK